MARGQAEAENQLIIIGSDGSAVGDSVLRFPLG